MRDPVKAAMKRGGTTLLNAMTHGDQRMFAMEDSLVGEKPHAAMIAATDENPALLRAILRLIARHVRPAPSAAPARETHGTVAVFSAVARREITAEQGAELLASPPSDAGTETGGGR
jgi:hypothetical protein